MVISRAGPRWTDYIRSRLRQNKDCRILFCGQAGSGKSYSCLSLGEELDPGFSVDRVCFSLTELLSLINSSKLSRGSVIILEEAGTMVNARQWFSALNRTLSYLTQTMRSLGFVLFVNTLDMSFIDSQVRKSLTGIFEMQSIDFKTKEAVIKPLLVSHNSSSGKTYFKYLRLRAGGQILPYHRLRVKMPSKALIDKYELKKSQFLNELNKKLLADVQKIESGDDAKPKNEPSFRQNEVLQHLKDGKTSKEIAELLGVAQPVVRIHISKLREKGFVIKQTKNAQWEVTCPSP